MPINKKGVSLVEVIFAVMILGLTGYVANQLLSQGFQKKKDLEVKNEFPQLLQSLHGSGQAFMSAKSVDGGGNPIANSRFCEFLTFTDVETGTTDIRVTVNKSLFANLFKVSEWETLVEPIGKPNNNCGQPQEQSIFSHCIEFNEQKDAKGNELYGRFDIYLKRLQRGGAQPFVNQPNGLDKIDAKEVIFDFETSVFSKNKELLAKRQGILWMSEIGECELNGRKIEVSATGPGDISGEKLYNNTQFMLEEPKEPFEINIQRLSIQEGLVLQNGSLVSNENKNIEMSCTEKKYRCPNSSKQRAFNPYIDVNVDLNYIGNEKVLNLPEVKPKFSFEINKGSKKYTFEKKDLDITTGIQNYIAGNDGLHYQRKVLSSSNKSVEIYQDSKGQKIFQNITTYTYGPDTENPLRMSKGNSSYFVTLNNSAPMCTEVCNDVGAKYQSKFWLRVAENGDFKQSYEVGAPLGCTVCYMKNCGQLGLGTFGPQDKQPHEPLDAQLPECALEEGSSVAVNDPLKELGSISSLSAGKCVAARLNGAKNALILEAKDCSESLPALCFGYGRFNLTHDNTASSKTLVAGAFSDAPRKCYEMSKEVLNPAKVQEMFSQYNGITPDGLQPFVTMLGNNTVTIGGTSYGQYYNNAFQSLFLAPQTNDQIADTVKNLSVNFPSIGSNSFWLNLRVSQDDVVYGDAPIYPMGTSENERYSFYFTDSGLPYIMRDTISISSEVTTGNQKGAVLFYGIRHRGLRFVNDSQSSSMPVICKRKGGDKSFFVTSGKVNSAGAAHSRCLSEGGVFISPLTTMQWSQAMHSLNPHGEMISFPDPRVSVLKKAWVSLNNDLNDRWKESSALAQLRSSVSSLSSYDFDKGFIQITGDISTYSIKKLCINKSDYSAKVVPYSSGCSGDYERFKDQHFDNWLFKMKAYEAIVSSNLSATDLIRVD